MMKNYAKKYFPTIILASYLIFLGPLIFFNVGWDMPNSHPGAIFVKPGIHLITSFGDDFFGAKIGWQPMREYPSIAGWFLSTLILVGIFTLFNFIVLSVMRAPRKFKLTIIVAIYLLISLWLPAEITVFRILKYLPFVAGYGGSWGLESCNDFFCLGHLPTWGGWFSVTTIALLIVFIPNYIIVSHTCLKRTKAQL